MRHARRLALTALAGLVAAAGCTHNHYYGNAIPVCEVPAGSAPVVTASAPAAYSYGAVCEVPTRVVGGTAVAQGSSSAKPVVTLRQPPSRIVVSEPTGRRPGTRVGWRNRAEDAGATTQISGAYDDDLIR